ncbi:hypothetical protein BHE74_00001857 [Ensete ventricosum]|nr:hypothetical protein BHE74_00001857 [Ensete ventricosum]
MVMCMNSRMVPPATVSRLPGRPIPRLVGTSRDGQAMGTRLDWQRHFRCLRSGRGSMVGDAEKRLVVQMSIATTDVGTEVKVNPPSSGRPILSRILFSFRDLDLDRRNPGTVVAVILGGGAGTRLFPLTKRRAKPAVSNL